MAALQYWEYSNTVLYEIWCDPEYILIDVAFLKVWRLVHWVMGSLEASRLYYFSPVWKQELMFRIKYQKYQLIEKSRGRIGNLGLIFILFLYW